MILSYALLAWWISSLFVLQARSAHSLSPAETLVVTAPALAVPTAVFSAPLVVFTRDDIERWQAKTVSEALSRLPGVTVTQNGGVGQLSSLMIRGAPARHTLILIDGIRLNQADGSGAADLSQIPLALIQRIEYFPGVRSLSYSADAPGGVINLITLASAPDSTVLNLESGRHGWRHIGLNSRKTLNTNTTITAATSVTSTRGYDVVAGLPDSSGTPAQPDRDGFRNQTFYVALTQPFTAATSLLVRGYGYGNQTEYDGYLSDTTLVHRRQLTTQNWDVRLQTERASRQSELIASYSRTRDRNYDPAFGPRGRGASQDERQQSVLHGQTTFLLTNGELRSGLAWRQATTTPGTSGMRIARQRHTLSAWLNGEQRWRAFMLEAALRTDKDSQFGRYTTGQVGGNWQLTTHYRLSAGWARAYSAPTLSQLYSDYAGNPTLKPEDSRQWELALNYSGEELQWRFSGYRHSLVDLIDYDSARAHYQNVGRAMIKGLEASLMERTGWLEHQVTWDYLTARDARTGLPLPRRARQHFRYSASADWLGKTATITGSYTGPSADYDYRDVDPQRVKTGGYSLWETALSWPLGRHVTVHGKITNLFDKRYQTVFGYPGAGREYIISGNYVF